MRRLGNWLARWVVAPVSSGRVGSNPTRRTKIEFASNLRDFGYRVRFPGGVEIIFFIVVMAMCQSLVNCLQIA